MILHVVRWVPRVSGGTRAGLLLGALVAGCGGSDDGGIDVEASKKIAAERGISPGNPHAPAPKVEKSPKAPPGVGLAAPPLKNGR